MRSRISNAVWKLLDALFPPRCAGCGEWGEKYCQDCTQKTRLIGYPICQICGEPLAHTEQVICVRCRTREIAFTAVRTWAYFEDPLQTAIHRLKYQRDIGLGSALALPMIDLLKAQGWQIDLITPVPLDPARQKQRGYNQSALLARPIAWDLGIDYLPEAVYRIRETRQQVGLNREERRANMEQAFKAEKKYVNGKTMLLVDDVITTGATLNSSARSLRQAGAETVYGLTLARSAHLYL